MGRQLESMHCLSEPSSGSIATDARIQRDKNLHNYNAVADLIIQGFVYLVQKPPTAESQAPCLPQGGC